jgi:ethanolamine transporter EutH
MSIKSASHVSPLLIRCSLYWSFERTIVYMLLALPLSYCVHIILGMHAVCGRLLDGYHGFGKCIGRAARSAMDLLTAKEPVL